MKRDVLSRYDMDDDGHIIIDVAAEGVDHLYNNFDRWAPYVRRDLNQDLVDYLIDSAKEVGQAPYTIQFSLARSEDETKLSRISKSINQFFLYLVELERENLRQMVRKSLVLFTIGLFILALTIWLHQTWITEDSLLENVLAEGLTIAAWVSLWEALAIFLIEWFPHQRRIKLYLGLASAKLIFRCVPMSEENNETIQRHLTD